METIKNKAAAARDKIVDHCDKYKNVYMVGGTILANYLIFKSDGISINIIKNSELINSAVGIGNQVIGNGHAGKIVQMINPNGTIQTFASLREAERSTGVSTTVIRRCASDETIHQSTGALFKIVGDALSKQ